MTIKKYLHSCLLVEEGGKKLLFDPGLFSFIEKKLEPQEIGSVDVIVLTHRHQDHYYPEALKIISAMRSAIIVANSEIAALLAKESLPCEVMAAGEQKSIAGFIIRAYEAPHAPIPADLPHNLAFLINNRLLHPGDSYTITKVPACEILALPITAPWARLADALDFTKAIKPKLVIPIHDAFIKDFMLEWMYATCKAQLEPLGIAFQPLGIGEAAKI